MKDTKIFDYDYYYENNKDVLRAGMDGLVHFVLYGRFEGRRFLSQIDLPQAVQGFLESRDAFDKAEFLDHVAKCIEVMESEENNDMLLRQALDQLAGSAGKTERSVVDSIVTQFSPPIHKYKFKHSGVDRPRVNIVVPTLNDSAIYGGIKTAMDFFLWLVTGLSDDVDYRIISQNDSNYGEIAKQTLEKHGFQVSPPEIEGGRVITSGESRSESEFTLRERDLFITTFWATAVSVQDGLDDIHSASRVCHFLQDYEPNFYPANSLKQMCLSSLRHERNGLYIANSRHLADFIERSCDLAAPCISFTPRINPALRPSPESVRTNVVLFYARKNPRNLFELGRMALSMFHDQYPSLASEFQYLGIGDITGSYPVGGSSVLHCLGKLTLQQYRGWMGRARVGLSLMMAPHPSYPPLEMAYNGLRVVTNDFGTKKMGAVHANIMSAEDPSPDRIRDLLHAQCVASISGQPLVGEPFQGLLEGFDSAEDPFAPLWEHESFRAVFGQFR